MDIAAEKLNLIQQILLFDEATFARLQHIVATHGLSKQANSVGLPLSDEELTAQFHEARRQVAANDTYSTAEVMAMMQQWPTK